MIISLYIYAYIYIHICVYIKAEALVIWIKWQSDRIHYNINVYNLYEFSLFSITSCCVLDHILMHYFGRCRFHFKAFEIVRASVCVSIKIFDAGTTQQLNGYSACLITSTPQVWFQTQTFIAHHTHQYLLLLSVCLFTAQQTPSNSCSNSDPEKWCSSDDAFIR